MIRKLIFSICMMCLVLVGCTDDNLMPSPQTPLPAKTVPVRLNLSTETYNTPPHRVKPVREEEIPFGPFPIRIWI